MRSILDTKKGICFECGEECFTHDHHIFDGKANRPLSTKYGLRVDLCIRCHEQAHKDIKLMRKLQEKGQRAFEDRWGSRKKFVEIFGRNYIDEYIDEEDKMEVRMMTDLAEDGMFSATLKAKRNNGEIVGRKYTGFKDESDSETRAELKAILLGLGKIIRPCRIDLYIKNTSTQATFNLEWLRMWENNDWKNSKGNLVKNVDLWQQISKEMKERKVGITAHGRNEAEKDW